MPTLLVKDLQADGVTLDGVDQNKWSATANGGRGHGFWHQVVKRINEVAWDDREAITAAGALDPFVYGSALQVSGTMAFTLAAPTYAGQRKRVSCKSAASSPLGTLTITSPDSTSGSVCSTTFVFTTAGQAIDLEATAGLKWRCTRVDRAGQLTVVPGTDVLTGLNLYKTYALAVTGTLSGTTTGGIPNGSSVGERCYVGCNLAASTPHGNMDGTYLLASGAAGTHLGDFAATTSQCGLEWNGLAWQIFGAVGGIVAS